MGTQYHKSFKHFNNRFRVENSHIAGQQNRQAVTKPDRPPSPRLPVSSCLTRVLLSTLKGFSVCYSTKINSLLCVIS